MNQLWNELRNELWNEGTNIRNEMNESRKKR